MDGALLELSFMFGFYDYDAPPTDPIRDIYDMYAIESVYGVKQTWIVRVKENRVIYTNGTVETFYSISDTFTYDKVDSIDFFNIQFFLDHEIGEFYNRIL